MAHTPPQRRARRARLFGVALIALAILTVTRFAYQEHQNSRFQTCVSELATTMIARSEAADRERRALRVVVGQLGMTDNPDRDAVDRAYADYKDAAQNADQIRQSTERSISPISDCVAR